MSGLDDSTRKAVDKTLGIFRDSAREMLLARSALECGCAPPPSDTRTATTKLDSSGDGGTGMTRSRTPKGSFLSVRRSMRKRVSEATAAACFIQIDDVRLALGHQAWDKSSRS